VALLDVQTGMLEFANAGHEPPFVGSRDGAPVRLGTSGGPPLCVLDDFAYPTDRRQLRAGDWLLAMTDGATEAMNPAREFFGVERLQTSLSWMPAEASPEELVRRLRDDVKRFSAGAELPDDITLLAMKWVGSSAGR
jgi:serine phosphatase RsbU (regulator of sigma subunit)